MEFKNRLKELRQQSGLSQEALAKEICVSRSTIAKWESGLGVPNDSNVEELCKYFNVAEEWLLDRNDLKKEIKITKREVSTIATAALGVLASLICVLLGFVLTFYNPSQFIMSYYYPPLPLFEFVVTRSDVSTGAIVSLLWASVAIWNVLVTFAVLSVAIRTLRQKSVISCSINIGLIVLSLVMFLVLFYVALQVDDPVYKYFPTDPTEKYYH